MRREEQAGLLSVLLQYLLLTHTVKVHHQTVCVYLYKQVSRSYVTSQNNCQSVLILLLSKWETMPWSSVHMGGEGRGGGGEERGGEGVLGLVVGVKIVRMGQEERRENVQMEGPK